jgi:CheY-like chemotaxis protein
MTAFPTLIVREQMLASGAHAFLTKPVDPDELLAAIETAIA